MAYIPPNCRLLITRQTFLTRSSQSQFWQFQGLDIIRLKPYLECFGSGGAWSRLGAMTIPMCESQYKRLIVIDCQCISIISIYNNGSRRKHRKIGKTTRAVIIHLASWCHYDLISLPDKDRDYNSTPIFKRISTIIIDQSSRRSSWSTQESASFSVVSNVKHI